MHDGHEAHRIMQEPTDVFIIMQIVIYGAALNLGVYKQFPSSRGWTLLPLPRRVGVTRVGDTDKNCICAIATCTMHLVLTKSRVKPSARFVSTRGQPP